MSFDNSRISVWSLTLDFQTILATLVLTFLIAVIVHWGVPAVRRIHWFFFRPLVWNTDKPHLRPYTHLKKGSVLRSGEKKAPSVPDYPNGWFYLLSSDALLPGHATSVRIFGVELAVYRTEDGTAYALDAYCAHLGANLGKGGRVKDQCIECPFHGWQFRGLDGKCMSIPGVKKIPEMASLKSWALHEDNKVIYVWHHGEGLDPSWYPPSLPNINGDKDCLLQATSDHLLYCHAQDIPENGADFAHFDFVHTENVALGSDITTYLKLHEKDIFSPLRALLDKFPHDWSGSWQPNVEDGKHTTQMVVNQRVDLGKGVSFAFKVHIDQVGPGLVNFDFTLLGGLWRGTMCQYVVPVAPQRTRLVHNLFGKTGSLAINRLGCKFIFWGFLTQVERDIIIWNNKAPTHRPIFCKVETDERLVRFHRWYNQFYSYNSDGSPMATGKAGDTEW